MKKITRIVSLMLVFAMLITTFAGCTKEDSTVSSDSNTSSDNSTDTSKEVNLVYYLWGSEGAANKDILAEINKKLKKDINATLEIKYIDWSDVATKYPLLFASGESFDMSHASPNAVVSYFTLAQDDALVDISTMLNKVAPKLKSEIPDSVWASTKVDGKIYGVPTLYSEFTPNGFVYRRDLKEKYGVEKVNSIETMEAYLDKAADVGELIPMNGNAALAIDLYSMFVDLTKNWIFAPGIPYSEMCFVSESADKYNEIFHPAFTQEFEDFAVKMREWADKGYWTKDILSTQSNDKDNTLNGLSASYITHMTDWTGTYGAFKEKLPGVETDFWCFAESHNKILRKMGVENSTVISTTSKNPERALQAIELFMTDESYYRLIQYGIEGRQYKIVDNKIVQPENFNPEVDGGGFSVWSLRSDKYNIPLESEDPRRYELIDKWNKTAIDNPFVGFSFNQKNVATELASIANVNATLGTQIMLGKTPNDPKEAVKQYREQLKQAGIEKVIEEIKTQLANSSVLNK